MKLGERLPDKPGSEAAVVMDASNDIELLIAADKIIADDILIYAVDEILKREMSPSKAVSVVGSLIRNRGGLLSKAFVSLDDGSLGNESGSELPTSNQAEFFPDLTSLSKRAYQSLLSIIADVLRANKQPSDDPSDQNAATNAAAAPPASSQPSDGAANGQPSDDPSDRNAQPMLLLLLPHPHNHLIIPTLLAVERLMGSRPMVPATATSRTMPLLLPH